MSQEIREVSSCIWDKTFLFILCCFSYFKLSIALCRVATLYFSFLIFLSLHLLSEVLGVAGVKSLEKDLDFEIVSFYVFETI